jgi:hypothetical protein
MEVRVARPEEAMPRIEARLDRVGSRLGRQGIARLDGKTDILAGQVIAKPPSWWQVPTLIGATVAPLVGLWAQIQDMRAHGLL